MVVQKKLIWSPNTYLIYRTETGGVIIKGNHNHENFWISDLNQHRLKIVTAFLQNPVVNSNAPNTSKFVKNTLLRVVFSTLFSALTLEMW